jgi:hypothetical protein
MILTALLYLYIGSAIVVAIEILFPIKTWADLGWGLFSTFTPIINTLIAFFAVSERMK